MGLFQIKRLNKEFYNNVPLYYFFLGLGIFFFISGISLIAHKNTFFQGLILSIVSFIWLILISETYLFVQATKKIESLINMLQEGEEDLIRKCAIEYVEDICASTYVRGDVYYKRCLSTIENLLKYYIEPSLLFGKLDVKNKKDLIKFLSSFKEIFHNYNFSVLCGVMVDLEKKQLSKLKSYNVIREHIYKERGLAISKSMFFWTIVLAVIAILSFLITRGII